MLRSGFGDHGFEFLWEPDFAAANAPDEAWSAAFRRFGGEIVISGDKNLAKRPHQILAFMETGLVGFFLDRKWSGQDMTFKAAHLIMWWPRIQGHLAACKARDCWWVPMGLRTGDFTRVQLPTRIEASSKNAATSD
jgi:hypothetical protein